MKLTGLILAGGMSRRMGRDKAFLEVGGEKLINRVIKTIAPVCDPLFIVGLSGHKVFSEIEVIADIRPGFGAIMGIYSGLMKSPHDSALVTACDMPCINTGLVNYMAGLNGSADVIIPRINGDYEPLLAIYSKKCLSEIEKMIEAGKRRIYDFFPKVKVRELTEMELRPFDPKLKSFVNINTPGDLKSLGI